MCLAIDLQDMAHPMASLACQGSTLLDTADIFKHRSFFHTSKLTTSQGLLNER